jgi:acyl dehydratase
MLKMIKEGDKWTHAFSFTQSQVEQFAQVSGDTNPLHLDAAYAATTVYKKPVMHGILSASVFSKVLGTVHPGEGTVYLSQQLDFKRPMYPDVLYEAVFEVKQVIASKHQALLSTSIREKETGKDTLRGEAWVMHKEKIA